MTLRRRDVLRLGALPLAAPLPALALANPAALPLAAALDQELAAALQRRKPLLVMVSLHGCPFCHTVRQSHLLPLLRDTGQPIVQVDMQNARAMRDLDGRPTTHAAMVTAWKVRAAPTVLFFGTGGREVAPRLEGASIPDFYGAYLDERLAAATRAL